jgi:hypothetical protein
MSFRAITLTTILTVTCQFTGPAARAAMKCRKLLSLEQSSNQTRFEFQRDGKRALTRGDNGRLVTAGGQVYNDATYLGFEYIDSRPRLLFAGFSRSTTDLVRVYKSDLATEADLPVDFKDVLMPPSAQGCQGTCLAHAVSNEILSKRTDLGQLLKRDGGREFLALRKSLLERAIPAFHGSKGSQFLEMTGFLKTNGLHTEYVGFQTTADLETVHELLKNGVTGVLRFNSVRESNYGDRDLDDRGNDVGPRSMHQNALGDRRSGNGHAVLLLGIVASRSGEERVIVYDSAYGELQFWFWGSFKEKAPRADAGYFYISPGANEDPKQISSSMIRRLNSRGGPKQVLLAEWLAKNKDRTLRLEPDDLLWTSAPRNTWVLLRRDPRADKIHDVIVGQIVATGTYANSKKRYIEIRQYQNGEFSKYSDPIVVSQHDVLEAYTIEQVPEYKASQREFERAIESGAQGDLVRFQWREFLDHDPIQVQGVVIAVADGMLTVYDRHTKREIWLRKGDLTSNFQLRRMQDRFEMVEPVIREAQIAKMAEVFKVQIYNSRSVSSFYEPLELARYQDLLRSVYPRNDKRVFDTQSIQPGKRVVIKLRRGRTVDVGFRDGVSVFAGTVIGGTPNEVEVALDHGRRSFGLEVDDVDAILQYIEVPTFPERI